MADSTVWMKEETNADLLALPPIARRGQFILKEDFPNEKEHILYR